MVGEQRPDELVVLLGDSLDLVDGGALVGDAYPRDDPCLGHSGSPWSIVSSSS